LQGFDLLAIGLIGRGIAKNERTRNTSSEREAESGSLGKDFDDDGDIGGVAQSVKKSRPEMMIGERNSSDWQDRR